MEVYVGHWVEFWTAQVWCCMGQQWSKLREVFGLGSGCRLKELCLGMGVNGFNNMGFWSQERAGVEGER